MSIVLGPYEIQNIGVPQLWAGAEDSVSPGNLVAAIESPDKKVPVLLVPHSPDAMALKVQSKLTVELFLGFNPASKKVEFSPTPIVWDVDRSAGEGRYRIKIPGGGLSWAVDPAAPPGQPISLLPSDPDSENQVWKAVLLPQE
ncbi:hypothetical protein CTheo_4274 [Ceratobasidium theobromae]|uniref:Ricin B lectin domain-containing protein n=1 Tax=Ceratobasidium theobromae TaxID=1582974 RepID=A0A5N5QLY7_9AGAM|nr:hypothetical protein CTheo_4274 [Ceratobasidium theobromae]